MTPPAVESTCKAWESSALAFGTMEPEICEARRRMEGTVTKTLVAAYLLTASTQQAQCAVTAALDAWDAENGCVELLLKGVLTEAVALSDAVMSNEELQALSDKSGSIEVQLPAELRPVLGLPTLLRRCYVLRILIGLSHRTCAELLQLERRQVQQYTCAALRLMPALASAHIVATKRVTWATRAD